MKKYRLEIITGIVIIFFVAIFFIQNAYLQSAARTGDISWGGLMTKPHRQSGLRDTNHGSDPCGSHLGER